MSVWMIETHGGPYIHWIALCGERVTRDAWTTVRHGDSPLLFVKDPGAALQFARKQDADIFIRTFERFLMNAEATEHDFCEDGEQS